jgi:hypothetical protein
LRGLGRISFRSVHARGIGGIDIPWMQILEETPGRIRGFDTFEETPGRIKGFDKFEDTLDVVLQRLGKISVWSVHVCGDLFRNPPKTSLKGSEWQFDPCILMDFCHMVVS